MAVPYFNSHSLSSNVQRAYEYVMSGSVSVLHDYPYCKGMAFGMEVQQTAPNNYLNISNPYGECFHNPFRDYRFPKVQVRVLYHQEPRQRESLGSSNKTKAQQSDENILYTGQSGFRIDRVWSMADKADSQPHSINANHSPLDSTLKNTAGNGSSGMGRSTPQISSVVDNTSQKRSEKWKASRKACRESGKYMAHQKAYRQSDKSKAYQKDYQKVYRESDKGRAARKAYAQSEKGKATRKAYEQSDQGQASRKAYEQSGKRKASRKAYEQSEKRKAYEQSEKRKASHKAYLQSDKGKATRKAYRESDKARAYHKAYHKAYQKAYREVFRNTGDKEQAKIAGKQATAFMRKSNKKKNSEFESISISPLTPQPASPLPESTTERP